MGVIRIHGEALIGGPVFESNPFFVSITAFLVYDVCSEDSGCSKMTPFLTVLSPEKTELLLLVHRGGCTPKQLSFPEMLLQPLLILCFEYRKMVLLPRF